MTFISNPNLNFRFESSDPGSMQIFAYTECPEFEALLEVECKEITGHRPIVRKSVDELKSLMSIFQTIDLLVVDLPEDSGLSVELKLFINSSTSRIKQSLVLGGDSSETQNVKTFSRFEINDLFDSLKVHFKPAKLPDVGYTAVPLCTLIHFQSLPFDLFIKLSSERFVKRVPAFEEVPAETIDGLLKKGIKELYCERRHNRDFSMMLINNMINRVDRTYDSFEEEMHANGEVYQTTKEIIQSLGIAGRVIEVCDTSIDKMIKDVMNEPSVFSSHLLKLKKDKKLAFQYKFITLVNYIGTQLIMEMELPNVEEQIRKFVFASYFCDITLKNPKLLHIRRPEDTDQLHLEDQNEVNFHALKASELVATHRGTPKEVALIVQQHHGSFSGIGFPAEKSYQLLPLSKVLIVSQDLAFGILKDEEAPVLEVLKKFLQKNNCSGLEELMNSLEESFAKTTT
jgi:hypothetical protein